MKLSPEWFRDLAQNLGGTTSDGKVERRRASRVAVQVRVPLSMISKGERQPPVPIMVRDFSPRGINILYPEKMEQGQQFTIQLQGSQSNITLLCTALHSERVANGLHGVGAEFSCVLPQTPEPYKNPGETQQRIRSSMLR